MSAVDEYLAPWKKEGKYLAGWEVEPSIKPPEGWHIWEVPEHTYAVVACTMVTYGEAFKFFLQLFLPKEGYEQAGAVHEFYPKEFRDTRNGTLYCTSPSKKVQKKYKKSVSLIFNPQNPKSARGIR
jgi:hypothetical protein